VKVLLNGHDLEHSQLVIIGGVQALLHCFGNALAHAINELLEFLLLPVGAIVVLVNEQVPEFL
jgi:hypothetical protein